ncbi:MAG: ribonuclease P protein component [Candidatus Heteroscillospira sp.]
MRKLKSSVSIKNNYEFRRLYSKGKSAATPFLVVYCRKTRRDHNRLGITVTAKMGKAVERNRIRRRFREIYRLNADKLKQGYDIIVVARMRSRTAEYRQLDEAYLAACSRLGLLSDAEKRVEK